jgi:hypothetical protein
MTSAVQDQGAHHELTHYRLSRTIRCRDRSLFVIETSDGVRQYMDFAECVADLTASLAGATSTRSIFARGQYDADSNVFAAIKLGVYLLEP